MNWLVIIMVMAMAAVAFFLVFYLGWSVPLVFFSVAAAGLIIALLLMTIALLSIPRREWPEALKIVRSTMANNFREIIQMFK